MSRRRRNIALALGSLGALTLAGLAVFPLVSGRTTPPEFSRRSADQALEEARAAGAARWAPQPFADAEARWREALVELRRQEVRFLILRDFRAARTRLRDAEAAARWAAEVGARERSGSREAAARAIARTHRLIQETRPLLESCRFDPGPGKLLRQAGIHLAEAESLAGRDEHSLSRLRAEQALSEVREARQEMLDAVSRFVDPENVARWEAWTRQTIGWSKSTGRPAIVVDKDSAVLKLYERGREVRRYSIEIGRNQLRTKRRAGDLATPEGRYNVIVKKPRGRSRYHAALELDYPNAEDLQRFRGAQASGEIASSARPGSLIEIHGHGGKGWDWTDGCIALTDAEIEHLFARVPLGTPVTIVGSHGRGGRFTTAAARLAEGDDAIDRANS